MYILFDLGKTKLRVAGTEDKKNITPVEILKSPNNLKSALDLLVETALKISGSKIDGFVGGITAALDKSRGKETSLIIREKIDRPVFIQNDSSLGALGEAIYGAGKNEKIVGYITVSTGIGGARIADSKIDEETQGFEPGHQIISYKENETLQNLASGEALQKKYNKPPKEIHDPELWKELGAILAVGVYNSILHWMPDIVVLGGSMITGSPAIPISEIEKRLREINTILPSLPQLKMSELGDENGIYGALTYLKQKTGNQF
ncbi:MAG: ROK family protein [Patescibacteria group bacterium]